MGDMDKILRGDFANRMKSDPNIPSVGEPFKVDLACVMIVGRCAACLAAGRNPGPMMLNQGQAIQCTVCKRVMHFTGVDPPGFRIFVAEVAIPGAPASNNGDGTGGGNNT